MGPDCSISTIECMAMSYTYEQLHEKTVAELREVAREIADEAVSGYSTMHKDDLLKALCSALGIEAHVHHEVVGIDKAKIKAQIRELKKQRDSALTSGDKKYLKQIRRRIHRLKREIRRATV